MKKLVDYRELKAKEEKNKKKSQKRVGSHP